MLILKIPFGIILLIPITILIILKKNFPKKEKIINNILYILYLLLAATVIFVIIYGFGYPCPCGCGSKEVDYGIKVIISLFTKESDYIFLDTFPYSIIYITINAIIIHIIIQITKYIKKKKMSN